MTRERVTFGLAIAGAVITVLVVLAASGFTAKTPSAVLKDLPQGPAASPAGEQVGYTLPEGRSARDIGGDLERLGVVRSGEQFALLVKLMGLQSKLSTGDYVLNKNMAVASAIEAVTVKQAIPVLSVTFPEGIRTEEMAIRAERAGFGTAAQFMAAVAAAKLPERFAATAPADATKQGYLFPDTYIMPVGSTPAQLVEKMLQTFDRRFTPELVAAAAAKGLNPHQALTLAAIVEREAALEAERPLIAGVFLNRIAANDQLGADPTVQFAVALDPASVEKFGWWKKELTLEDLKNPSPYNTRLAFGLPPGPITNPGLASIEAVAKATPTRMYYFVADAKKGDGSHVFAETESEHFANIARVGSP
ncbi:MAG TPA: endolytic transglycosylase MltG [Tepidiformaceae bacterium]|nr:endolytic transglycosylase MltG [Thermoflexaceae bacterium]HMS59119.1 endolytic transglycosylase MltG [Tepidiformaceae bacterium]